MKGWNELWSPNSMPVGRAGTCGVIDWPAAAALRCVVQWFAVGGRHEWCLGQRVGDGDTGAVGDLGHPHLVLAGALVVRDELEDPAAGLGHGVGDSDELRGRGRGARYEAMARGVEDRARR